MLSWGLMCKPKSLRFGKTVVIIHTKVQIKPHESNRQNDISTIVKNRKMKKVLLAIDSFKRSEEH